MFHGESLPCRSESPRCLTASLFFAGRSRLGVSRRLSSVQVGVAYVFCGESLPCRSGSSRCVTASLFLASRSRLGVSRRVSSASLFFSGRSRLGVSMRLSPLQVGVVYVFHGESLPYRSVSSCFFRGESLLCRSAVFCFFTASLFLAARGRLGSSLRVACLQVAVV